MSVLRVGHVISLYTRRISIISCRSVHLLIIRESVVDGRLSRRSLGGAAPPTDHLAPATSN